MTTRIGATSPIVAYPGTTAIAKVPTDISASVRINPARRPWASI